MSIIKHDVWPCRIVTIANQKGGVAKTTTAVSVAHGVSISTSPLFSFPPVNLVDLDQQGQCAIGLGMSPTSAVFDYFVGDADLANCLTGCQSWSGAKRDGLSLLAGNARTKHVDLIYRNEVNGFDLLCDRLNAVAKTGFLVIDTPPAGMLQEAAIRIADVVIIPTRCETLSVDSVHATISLARRLNSRQRIVVLPTMFDKRLGEHEYNLSILLNLAYDSTSVADPVPARSAVIEASAKGCTIWEIVSTAIQPVQNAYLSLLNFLFGHSLTMAWRGAAGR